MSIHEQIEEERRCSLPKAEEVKAFRQYARGRHPSTLTTGQQRILRGLLGNLFCDNVCKRILQELRNRLRLVRFDLSTDGQGERSIGTYLESVWVKNGLAAKSAAVHWAMFRDGNTAIALNWSKDRVVITRERWWNGKTGMFVSYDDDDRVNYAVKEWTTREGLRRTVYYPDKIERYIQDNTTANNDGWRMYKLPSDPQGDGPIEWKDRRGQPLGVPVVHFANIQVPNDGDGDDGTEEPDPHYGMSELDGGMLGLQDEVNDIHRDLSGAARFAGFPMMKGTGIKEERDENGNLKNPLIVEPGAFFTDENPQADFDVIQPGSLAELERILGIKLQAMTRAAAVPLHLIAGDWPSGEALLRAEMPLIDKVETVGASVGPSWASVAHKAVQMSNAFGQTSFDEEAMITAEFAPVARRDPLTLAGVAERLAKFVGQRETLRILNYSPKDIQRIIDDLKENPPQGSQTREGGNL
ncbi:MAG TPA: phage portal protein [Pyrinomonadaceae bacterium]|jgi:hypothetical protein